jgi:hypothetical protein
MKSTLSLKLTGAALLLAASTAWADDGLHGVAHLGEHPAVIVARRGVSVDPSTHFYLHPARLSWDMTRPWTEGEHPAVLVAHRSTESTIDPNLFILAHPAGGSPTARQ